MMSVYDCILIIRCMTKMCVVEHMFIFITQLVSTQSFAPKLQSWAEVVGAKVL